MQSRPFRSITLLAVLALGLASCETVRHQFAGPALDWKARSGQLLYHGKRTTLIGEVLVRFSKAGDFELTFTKGPGVTLLEIRQDANFFSVKGPLAGVSWFGRGGHAPPRPRGGLEMRDKPSAPGKPPHPTAFLA